MKFGTSGVRGIYGKDIDENSVREFFSDMGGVVVVSADARKSSQSLKFSAMSSLIHSSHVIDLGNLPTGLVAFSSKILNSISIQFTASHNPIEYAGFKIFRNGMGLRERPKPREKVLHPSLERFDILPLYLQLLSEFENKQKQRVLVDCLNGAGGFVLARIMKWFGWEYESINCLPEAERAETLEPSEEMAERDSKILESLGMDIGVMFDGDADRVIFFDREGFIGYNEAIALFAKEYLRRHGGKRVVTTVETGMIFEEMLEGYEIVRTRVGDISVAESLSENGIGVEQPGHYIIPSLYKAPDVFYPLLAMSSWFEEGEIREILDRIERPVFIKEKYLTDRKDDIMDRLDMEGERIDGILVRGNDWRLLVRASGTENAIRIIGEAYSKKRARELVEYAIEKIKEVEDNEGYNPGRRYRKKDETFEGGKAAVEVWKENHH